MFSLLRLALFSLTVAQFIAPSNATDRIGRLGIGYTNQFKADIPAISFKLQKSRSFALGGAIGIKTGDNGATAAGLKLYRNIFDEPQLNFYAAGLMGMIKKKTNKVEESGFQFDITMGTEFSFAGLQSLGFSTEFGFSFYKLNDFTVETSGSSFIVAGVHFYL